MKTEKLSNGSHFYAVSKVIIYSIVYILAKPFMLAKNAITKIRFRQAKEEADAQAKASKQYRYVVVCKGKFYVYNKGAMMALAKRIKKATGKPVDWRTISIYRAEYREKK